MTLITTQDALNTYAARLRGQKYVLLDTEFLREKTYYPQLCLIQAMIPDDEPVAIDALAEGLDLGPFWSAIADPTLLKVFHAGRQDLEIIVKATGAVPTPLFDTQIAASVLGYGEQVGFENLVRSILKHQLDKGSQFTDWARRPLTDRQVRYALDDVRYLDPIYKRLVNELKSRKRADWLDEDIAIISDVAIYQLDENELWRRVKIRSDRPRDLAVLRSITAWREREARARDLPRGRIIKDEPLGEIALHHPRTVDELAAIRGIDKGMARGKLGSALLAAIADGLALPEEQCPSIPRKRALSDEQEALLEILKFIVKMRARELSITPRLLASGDDLEHIVRHDFATSRLASGWRLEVFGRALLDRPYFGFELDLENKRVQITETPNK